MIKKKLVRFFSAYQNGRAHDDRIGGVEKMFRLENVEGTERLWCEKCGESARVISWEEHEQRFYCVLGTRNGKLCCQTYRCESEEAAVDGWKAMWEDGRTG